MARPVDLIGCAATAPATLAPPGNLASLRIRARQEAPRVQPASRLALHLETTRMEHLAGRTRCVRAESAWHAWREPVAHRQTRATRGRLPVTREALFVPT